MKKDFELPLVEVIDVESQIGCMPQTETKTRTDGSGSWFVFGKRTKAEQSQEISILKTGPL